MKLGEENKGEKSKKQTACHKHTVPGTVTVVKPQPKQCIEYVDVRVLFHTVMVLAVLVVTISVKVQSGQAGARAAT